MVGSSAGFISNTSGAIILGAVGGLAHCLLQRWERKIKWYFLIENNVLFLFGFLGVLGGLSSAIFVRIASSYHSGLYPPISPTTAASASHYFLPSHNGQLIGTGISVALGIGAGIVVGIVVNLISKETTKDHYHDRACWLTEQDGLSSTEDINLPDESEISNT